MLSNIVLICVFLITKVKSDNFNWKFPNGTEINDPYYCDIHKCIVKCCPSGFIMVVVNHTNSCRVPKKPSVKKAMNFSNINVYDMNKFLIANENLESKFTLVYDKSFFNKSYLWTDEVKILEDGSINMKDGIIQPKLLYCVDFLFKSGRLEGIPHTAILAYKTLNADDPDGKIKQDFVAYGMLVSCFFLILVLLIYSILPAVRGGLWGVILMIYLLALMITFMLKAWRNIVEIDDETCLLLTPVTYYFILCNLLWSNVMSFNMWFKLSNPTGRSTIKSREAMGKLDIKEKKKLAWYSGYAFGLPALITAFVVFVDKNELYANIYYKPPFKDCLTNKIAVVVYVHIPVAIITFANCVLFILTAYYIWFVDKNLTNTRESRTNKSRQIRFITYLKIFVLMGVNWLLELVPADLNLTLFIISVFPNVFSGVFIFLILICKKNVYRQLRKKFGRNKYVIAEQSSSSYRRQSSKNTSSYAENNLEESAV